MTGASVTQTLTGALSALQRLPRGCGYGPDVFSLGIVPVYPQSLLPTLSPREEQV